jgi:Icc protein
MPVTRIVQITDLHVFADPDERLFGIPTRELLLDVVADIESNAGPVDHLVVTGDHTHDEQRVSYEAVREILSPWLDRLWVVPGNHEDRALLHEVFGDRTGGSGSEPVRFSFTAGDWLCLGLDTHVPGEVAGAFDAEALRWVQAQLAAHDVPRAALFMHHPPVMLGCAWLDRIGLHGREQLQDLILADARIRLVCSGHVHHASSRMVGEAEVVTTPSTGLQFDPTQHDPTYARVPPGYRVIELDGTESTMRVARLAEARYAPVQNGERDG